MMNAKMNDKPYYRVIALFGSGYRTLAIAHTRKVALDAYERFCRNVWDGQEVRLVTSDGKRIK